MRSIIPSSKGKSPISGPLAVDLVVNHFYPTKNSFYKLGKPGACTGEFRGIFGPFEVRHAWISLFGGTVMGCHCR